VLGLTIDYGPYGWIDNFDPDWTPNTTDASGRRYRFGAQPQVAHWNLGRLAVAIAPLLGSPEPLEAGLTRYVDAFNAASRDHVAGKLGLLSCDDDDLLLMGDLQDLFVAAEVDMTIFFRRLADVPIDAPSLEPLAEAFYDDERMRRTEPAFLDWLARYALRAARDGLPAAGRQAIMDRANPRHVLRNYLVQEVIDRAEQGDPSGIPELLDVMRRPYEDQPGADRFDRRRPDWARHRAGCSMLSCSS
jgi:serine/tyrosine/threonine adenylyltransferase